MDNFSQENEEISTKSADETVATDVAITQEIASVEEQPANKGVEDIEFEEVFDLDTIQKKLQASLSGENPDDVKTLEDENALMIAESQKSTLSPQPIKAVDPNSKKFVIYIDPENIKYMESLSNTEKKEVINKILKEQNLLTKEEIERRAKTKYFKHAMLACFTFIVFFPLMFIAVNKSLESTISNYQKTKGTFSRLYKEQGKIKMRDSNADPTIKY